MTVATLLARALRSRRFRPWLAAAGIAICTLLVLALAGAFHGVRNSMASYAGQAAVDLWIAPPGSDNLIRGSFASLVPTALADSIRTLPGVRRVQPVLKAFLPIRALADSLGQRRYTLLAIGYEVPDGLGGPPAFAEGHPPKGRHQVALDRAAAWRLRVGLGDTIVLGGTKIVVTGLTRGTNILATQFFFADLGAASKIAGVKDQASFLLVALDSETDPVAMAQTIESRFPDWNVFTRAAFLANNEREVTAGFVPLLTLIAGLGVAAASILVGLLVHGVVEERRSDIAVLLALGARAPAVAAGVVRYALTLVCTGILAGVAGAWVLAVLLDRSLPVIPLSIAPLDALGVALLFTAAGLVAALVPVLSLRRIDPLEAFRP
jgi:ABC-type antimicrobial peptide transport system permease subunit